MKSIRNSLIVLSALVLLFSCRQALQMNQPVGNYLSLTLNFPESDKLDSPGRILHSQSDEVVISLTYGSENVVEYRFDRANESEMNILLENLTPGDNVLLEVSTGLKADNLALSSGSTTIDLKPGGNSAALILDYLSYTVQGTLLNAAGTSPIGGQLFDINGVGVTTDSSGHFSMTVSTENLTAYHKFYVPIVSGVDEYNFARTTQYLIDNRDDFQLKVAPEVYVDMYILSDSYPLEGATLDIGSEVGYNLASPLVADANGRILFQDTGVSGEMHDFYIEYKGVFVEYGETVYGSPGAIVGTVTLDPYVIFIGDFDYNSTLFKYDFAAGGTSPATLDVATLVSASDPGATTIYDTSMTVDYRTGNILIFSVYNNSGFKYSFFEMDGWNGTVTLHTTGSSPLSQDGVSFPYPYSAQQILYLSQSGSGNHVAVFTSRGVFTFDLSTNSVLDVWERTGLEDDYGFIANGGYESTDGQLLSMGSDYDWPGTSNNNPEQKIWNLTSGGGTYTFGSDLPAAYNSFNVYTNDYFSYAYILGIYPWGDYMMTVQTQTGGGSGGRIITLKNWSEVGSPIDNSYEYLVPVGILPNNKFYVMEESSSSGSKYLIEVDDPVSKAIVVKNYLNASAEVDFDYMFLC